MISISSSRMFQKQMGFVPLVEMSEENKYEYSLLNLDASVNVSSTTNITTDYVVFIIDKIPNDDTFPTSFNYKGNVFVKNCLLPVEQKQRCEQVLQWQQNNIDIIITDGFQYIDANDDSENISFFRIWEKTSKLPGFFGAVNEFSDIDPQIKNRIKLQIQNIIETIKKNKNIFEEIDFGNESKLNKWKQYYSNNKNSTDEYQKVSLYLSKLNKFIIDGYVQPGTYTLPEDLDNTKVQNYINRQIEKIPKLEEFLKNRKTVEEIEQEQLENIKQDFKKKYGQYVDMFTQYDFKQISISENSEMEFLEKLNEKLNTENLYNILQVERTANKRDIKQKYIQLSKTFHPDKTVGEFNQVNQEIQKKIIQAEDILTKYRDTYDSILGKNTSNLFYKIQDVAQQINQQEQMKLQEFIQNTKTIHGFDISNDFPDIDIARSELNKYLDKMKNLESYIEQYSSLETNSFALQDLKETLVNELEKIKQKTQENNWKFTMDAMNEFDNLDNISDKIKENLLSYIDMFRNKRYSISKEQFNDYKRDYYSEIKENMNNSLEDLLNKGINFQESYNLLQSNLQDNLQGKEEEIDTDNIDQIPDFLSDTEIDTDNIAQIPSNFLPDTEEETDTHNTAENVYQIFIKMYELLIQFLDNYLNSIKAFLYEVE